MTPNWDTNRFLINCIRVFYLFFVLIANARRAICFLRYSKRNLTLAATAGHCAISFLRGHQHHLLNILHRAPADLLSSPTQLDKLTRHQIIAQILIFHAHWELKRSKIAHQTSNSYRFKVSLCPPQFAILVTPRVLVVSVEAVARFAVQKVRQPLSMFLSFFDERQHCRNAYYAVVSFRDPTKGKICGEKTASLPCRNSFFIPSLTSKSSYRANTSFQ